MSKPRFTRDQIKAMVLELEAGQAAGEMSRRYGISLSTLYRWRARFSDGDENEQPMRKKEQLQALEDEHRRLKKQFAELTLDYATLRAALIKDVTGEC